MKQQSKNNSAKIKKLFIGARLLFGGIFVLSAVSKILDLEQFEKAIINFELLHESIVGFFALFISLAELVIGLLILLNIHLKTALRTVIFLLIFFTIIIISKIGQNSNLSCGCFGNLTSGKIDGVTIIRNVLFICYGIFLLVNTYFNKTNEREDSVLTKMIHELKIIGIGSIIVFLFASFSLLYIQNIQLKNVVNILLEKETLKVGDTFNNFWGLSKSGDVLPVQFIDYRFTLLFFMKSGCQPCKQNIPRWERIFKRVDENGNSILGVCFDSLRIMQQYFSEYDISFSAISVTNKDFHEKNKISLTPQTVLVNEKSHVVNVWKGILSDEDIKDIIKTLNGGVL